MSRVAPGLVLLHVRLNSKMNACICGWSRVGLGKTGFLVDTHCILDPRVVPWPRVIRHT